MRMLPAAFMALFLVSGCGDPSEKPENNLVFIMKNNTGGHMHDFDLDTGSGHIAYQIFSENYTFQKWIPIKNTHTLHLKYTTDDGTVVDEDLEWEVDPSQNGKILRIYFETEEVRFRQEDQS